MLFYIDQCLMGIIESRYIQILKNDEMPRTKKKKEEDRAVRIMIILESWDYNLFSARFKCNENSLPANSTKWKLFPNHNLNLYLFQKSILGNTAFRYRTSQVIIYVINAITRMNAVSKVWNQEKRSLSFQKTKIHSHILKI